jgi:bifunctional non-homologous end joining protein LigD
VLVDIYRIRSGQSIVSAYSLRGRIGAPVSMPITWDELKKIKDPKIFNIHNAVDKVLADGDAWESFAAFAVEILKYTQKEKLRQSRKNFRLTKNTKHLSSSRLIRTNVTSKKRPSQQLNLFQEETTILWFIAIMPRTCIMI